ncbi:MAG: FHA domain-containing protein [Gloeomargarita sp. HHBFW_bins_162]
MSQPTQPDSVAKVQAHHPRLVHVRTGTVVHIPLHQNVLLVGKPNDHLPPDINVAGFPDADVVSRIHARLIVQGAQVAIEDMGSTNGTYINGQRLRPGERCPLHAGDWIALGKEDKVTFLLQQD